MKKKKQQRYLDKRWKKLLVHLETYARKRDAEALHLFRVEFKKIKALVALTAACTKNKSSLKQLKPARVVFRHAGRIRSALVNLRVLEQYHLDEPVLKATFSRQAKKEAARFLKNATRYRAQLEKAHRKVLRELEDIPGSRVEHVYRKMIRKLSVVFSAKANEAQLHEARKQVKQLLYVRSLLPAALSRKLAQQESYLSKLQDTIGDWHDTSSLLVLLKSPGARNTTALKKLQVLQSKQLRALQALAGGFDKAMKP